MIIKCRAYDPVHLFRGGTLHQFLNHPIRQRIPDSRMADIGLRELGISTPGRIVSIDIRCWNFHFDFLVYLSNVFWLYDFGIYCH